VIVIDDCSTDDTQAVIGAIRDTRLKYIRQAQNTNMPGSWDAGLRASSGEFFAFLGDDDMLRPEFVERRMSVFEADPKVAVAFGCASDSVCAAAERWPMDAGHVNDNQPALARLLTHAITADWFITRSMYRRALVLPAWTAAADDGYVFDVGYHSRIVMLGLGTVCCVPADDVIVTRHPGQVSCVRRDQMFAQKERLILRFLADELPQPFAAALIDELANWHTLWGRNLVASHEMAAARRHFCSAVRLRPSWLHPWKQLAKSMFPVTSLSAPAGGQESL